MTTQETTQDSFLGGLLRIVQPKVGYRAATDPVLLAAAVSQLEQGLVLDVGCGVGVASLCLGRRCPHLELHGLEIQPEYADLAEQNARLNHQNMTVHRGDIEKPPAILKSMSFDVVLTNPPFFAENAHKSPNSVGKSAAQITSTKLADWIDHALKRLKPQGQFVMIHLAEQLPMAVQAVVGRCGDITILPISSREGRPAKRFILSARKGSRTPATLLSPLIMHQGAIHEIDGDDFTPVARAILRRGERIPNLK